MPTFPEWWNWDLSFTGHAELRMEHLWASRSLRRKPFHWIA
jgi:hypothetical protein